MLRIILHVDMDAFFAAVEQHDHPEWTSLPVVVGAPPDRRGVVAAASYEARAFGIRSAMSSREAGRRCPHAVFVRPRMTRYAEVSSRIFLLFEQFTPLVEPVSIDEAFLDVTGSTRLFGSGPEIAEQVRRAIRRETGLTASVGVAANKFLAKIASDLHKPDGVTVVPAAPDAAALFLASLPVDRLWGVGQVTQKALHAAGLRTISDLQRCPERRIRSLLGTAAAYRLSRLARGEDERPVRVGTAEKSLSREYTFDEDCTEEERIVRKLNDLVDDVAARLRATGRLATVARLRIRWDTFETLTRQQPLRPACSDDYRLRAAAGALYRGLTRSRPVRLVGFGATGLVTPEQESEMLFNLSPLSDRRERLSRTVDHIRARHGPGSIRRGGAVDSLPDPDDAVPGDP